MVGSCSHRGEKPRVTANIAPESLLGIVSITGTSFEQRIVLRSGNTSTYLATSPSDSASLSRVAGIEVVVRGRAEKQAFRVASFMAKRVDGAPVVDGLLMRDGDRLLLETANGRVPLGNPPAAFRAMVGARVWVGGPLDTGPNVYGVIVPPP
jgi:hypothetical protein